MCDAQFCVELEALDIAESGVELIKARELPSFVSAQVFDGVTLPYEDQRFDLVILSHVVEHLEHPRQLLYEAARVGRAVFIEVPLEDTRALKPKYVPDHIGHINVYSPRSIRHLIQTCGMTIQREHVHPASLRVHRHTSGSRGIIKYLTKRVALIYAPQLAPSLFTYHGAYLAKPEIGST
jgi:SAM-dependent methyltransferase